MVHFLLVMLSSFCLLLHSASMAVLQLLLERSLHCCWIPEDCSDSRQTFSRFHKSFLPLQVDGLFLSSWIPWTWRKATAVGNMQLWQQEISWRGENSFGDFGVKDLMYLLIRFPPMTVFVKRVFHSPVENLMEHLMGWSGFLVGECGFFFLKAEQFNLLFVTSQAPQMENE